MGYRIRPVPVRLTKIVCKVDVLQPALILNKPGSNPLCLKENFIVCFADALDVALNFQHQAPSKRGTSCLYVPSLFDSQPTRSRLPPLLPSVQRSLLLRG
jgi:hypothetical protein